MKKITIAAFTLSLFFGENVGAKDSLENSTEAKKSKNYYVDARSYGTKPETDPPAYVNSLDKTGIKEFKNVDWLDVGLQYRARLEHRDNDFRRSRDAVDDPLLSRARAYFAVKNILDPFRLTVEFQDSRKFGGKFPSDNNDVNKLEFIQAYGELYLKNGLGKERPISVRVGRMAFEVLDRRLIARNEWRNTTNNFQGIRALFGSNQNDWQLDTFALQPIIRQTIDTDPADKSQWFYGTILNWRRWSDVVTLQPFYLKLDQQSINSAIPRRNISSGGLRGYGLIGNTAFDYDLMGVYQFGNSGSQVHRALGGVAELGYTFDHKWKPRLSENFGYASGDANPSDSKNQRFEKLFGFGRPWSSNDYFQFENIQALKTRLELTPSKKLRGDVGYNAYWLASRSDRWNKANLRDNKGASGNFIGSEVDARVRYKLTSNLDSTVGYAYFKPGKFTRNVSRNNPSNFLYVELTWSLF